jgi:4-carboxymuconolactone decarboxylase
MSLQDPAQRTRTGVARQTELLAAPAPEPKTVFEASWRDFVFAEVWTRPQLDRRSRFWITIATAAATLAPPEVLDGYIRGALALGEVTLPELREAALHLAVYTGWSKGALLDQSVTRVATALDLPPAPYAPIRGEPWDPKTREAEGHANFAKVMTFPPGPGNTAYLGAGILNFVFGEMWTRPGLDQRARRWITLVGISESSTTIPISSHIHAAMASGDATAEEMHEFVLQYAIHAGWPKASVIQSVVFTMAQRVADGLAFM